MVTELAPLLRAHRDEAEQEKRLARPVLDALRDAGFFRMLRPHARGGLEMHPVSEFRIAEALARIDSAAAWNVQVCNASELYGGWFSDEISEEVFGHPEAVVAGAFNPHRRATPAEGGYIVSGQTSFNSNAHGATWFIGLADVSDSDDDTLLTAIPADQCTIIPNWNTMGMCGTGSHDVRVEEVFVPSARAVPFAPLSEPAPAYDNPLARTAVWITVGCHAAVALGVAQAALDDLVELGTKVPAYTQRSLRDRNTVQLRLARAEGLLGGARAFFHATFDAAWTAAHERGGLTLEEKAQCQLAGSSAVLTAAEVVDLVHSCVGTSGIRCEQRFQRHFRDVHVITQHAFICEARLEAVGQIRFQAEPDWGFFHF